MSAHFSDWYSKLLVLPDDSIMQSRQGTIKTFSQAIKNAPQGLSDVMALCRLAFLLPEANASSSLRDGVLEKVRAAFTASQSSFPTRGNDLEMRILAGGILEELVSGQDKRADIAALSIVCAPRIGETDDGCEQMLEDLKSSALWHLEWQSKRLRKLTPAAELKVAPAHETVAENLKKVKIAESTNDGTITTKLHAQMVNIVNAMGKLTLNINAAQEKSLSNQVIFAEEIDILWWLFGERSHDLNQPFENVGDPAVCLVAAKELADLTKILPQHQTASQFLSVALSKARNDLGHKDEVSIIRLNEAISHSSRQWREKWKTSFDDVMVPASVASLCPVLKAVELSLGTDGGEWVGFWKKATGLPENFSLSPLDLSLQLYRECLLLRGCR